MASAACPASPDGAKFIPASQRPDGTWRKPRRIKDGYVPQEEVPLYESKGKQFAARRSTDLPVGLTPEIVAAAKKKSPTHASPIPGLVINADKPKKNKKKKKTGVDDAADKLAKTSIQEPTFTEPVAAHISAPSQAEPAKRLKNLKKKLRDIEALEEKIKSGGLKTPDKDQIDKISKKEEVLCEIESLGVQFSD